MYIFSSLKAALAAGFSWLCFDVAEQLHIVELDRMGTRGQREKGLAFARP